MALGQAHEQAHVEDLNVGKDFGIKTPVFDFVNKSATENLKMNADYTNARMVAGERSASHEENIVRGDPTGKIIPL